MDAVAAQNNDIEMFVVGVTSFVNLTEVRLMSSSPQRENQTYWSLATFQSLHGVSQMIQGQLCTGEISKRYHSLSS